MGMRRGQKPSLRSVPRTSGEGGRREGWMGREEHSQRSCAGKTGSRKSTETRLVRGRNHRRNDEQKPDLVGRERDLCVHSENNGEQVCL